MKPPNRVSVVKAIDRENPGLKNDDPSAFTQLVAARLAAEDSRWGRYLNSRNNKSRDVLGWNDPSQLWGVDILIGAGRPNFDPPIAWQVDTRNGSWVFVPPESDDPGDPGAPDPPTDLEARVATLEAWRVASR